MLASEITVFIIVLCLGAGPTILPLLESSALYTLNEAIHIPALQFVLVAGGLAIAIGEALGARGALQKQRLFSRNLHNEYDNLFLTRRYHLKTLRQTAPATCALVVTGWMHLSTGAMFDTYLRSITSLAFAFAAVIVSYYLLVPIRLTGKCWLRYMTKERDTDPYRL